MTSAVGQGKEAFWEGLISADNAFQILRRPGRQHESAFLGAELGDWSLPPALAAKVRRNTSFTAKVALATLAEAWSDARLAGVDPKRVGLIVGGSNLQQRELLLVQEAHAGRPSYIPPAYGMFFMDTDICGLCTEQLGIRGLAFTVGGASASGQLAVLMAADAVESGKVDVCIALGALTDLSYWECQAFRALGAMGSDRFAQEPARACRPFDRDSDGFIFGEACAAVVVESPDSARRREISPYATVLGRAQRLHAERSPMPSREAEAEVMAMAMADAELEPDDIAYVNPHGTGSPAGDAAEVAALAMVGVTRAYVNATKSIVGHSLAAAGAVEVVATVLQMRASTLHATRNLERPIDPSLRWVTTTPVEAAIPYALCLSLGFGGVNTALCLGRP